MNTDDKTPLTDPDAGTTPDAASAAAPVKRGRGRPRKHPLPPQTEAAPNASDKGANEQPPRKRERSPKNPKPQGNAGAGPTPIDPVQLLPQVLRGIYADVDRSIEELNKIKQSALRGFHNAELARVLQMEVSQAQAPNASNEDNSIERLDELKNGVFDRARRVKLIEEICSIQEAPKTVPQSAAPVAPAVAAPSPNSSKKALLLAAEGDRARRMEEQRPALQYILTHTIKRASILIGVRARSKTATTKGRGAGTERPTLVAMLATDGTITERELGTPNAEMDFARGAYPIEWRLATPEETAAILLAKNDKKVVTSWSLPFLDRHIVEIKRGEAKRRFGEEALAAFLADQKTLFLLPTLFDGFQPLVGDRMLIPYGGEGDYFAVASFATMIPEDKRETHKGAVVRCTPGTLKQTRERAIEAGTVPAGKKTDLKDADHILLAQLLENPGDAPL